MPTDKIEGLKFFDNAGVKRSSTKRDHYADQKIDVDER